MSAEYDARAFALAISIAAAAHEGQVDKAGRPYILHPLRVAANPILRDDIERAIAVLHDTVEDTYVTLTQLKASRFSDFVINNVDALSRRKDEKHADYIERVIRAGSTAIRIKLADIVDNTRSSAAYVPPLSYLNRLERDRARLTSFLEWMERGSLPEDAPQAEGGR